MRLERAIQIAQSPDAVYKVVMDPHRLGEWVSIHERLGSAPEGILEQGSELTQTLKLAGRPFEVRWTVTVARRPDHVVWEGEGPARSRASVEYDLAPDGAGTRFKYVNVFELPGGALGRFASAAVERTSIPGRELERSLERLKGLLEG